MKKRLEAVDRKAAILDAAIEVAEDTHYLHMTRSQIAEKAGVSTPLVQHYFGNMPELRKAVMLEAVKRGLVYLVAQGLVAGDVNVKGATEWLRLKAAAWIVL